MTEFKVGDKVRCIGSGELDETGYGWEKGKIFIVNRITDNDEKKGVYWFGDGHGVFGTHLELVNPKLLKAPTHVVIWDEQDRDPHKFFTDEKEAKEFMKELSEKTNVKKDSIILVEIKSAQKVNITKNVRLMNYKI